MSSPLPSSDSPLGLQIARRIPGETWPATTWGTRRRTTARRASPFPPASQRSGPWRRWPSARHHHPTVSTGTTRGWTRGSTTRPPSGPTCSAWAVAGAGAGLGSSSLTTTSLLLLLPSQNSFPPSVRAATLEASPPPRSWRPRPPPTPRPTASRWWRAPPMW